MSESNGRHVFGYYNGKVQVFGDPLTIHRRLTKALDGDPATVLEQANSENFNLYCEAMERLVEAIREVFTMAPYDSATGEGATEEDCLTALNLFLGYMQKKSPPPVSTPTSPAPTA